MEKKLYEGIFTIDSFLLSPLLSSTPLYVYLVKKKLLVLTHQFLSTGR